MKTPALLPLLLAGLFLAGCTTTPTPPKNGVLGTDITVEFKNPDNFRDVRESIGGFTDENALAELRAYLKQQAPAHLQTGQKLLVTFTDIDLAGDFVPGARIDRVRIIKSIYIPRQVLSFAVTDAAGQTVKEGTRTLTDMNFMLNATRIGSDQSFFYDKQLLADWLREEFK
jgi:hypothetical protein